ncbi:hypothetical protein WME91_05780 [Sorangium sp. So ce269]
MQEEVEDFEGAHHGCRNGEAVVIGVEVQVGAEAVVIVPVAGRVQIETQEVEPTAGREAQLEVVGNNLGLAVPLFHLELKVEPTAVLASEMREISRAVEVANRPDGDAKVAVGIRAYEAEVLANHSRRLEDDPLITRLDEVAQDIAVKLSARSIFAGAVTGGVGSLPEPGLQIHPAA